MPKIYCCICNKHVGEIRNAKLIKGIRYLCPNCKTDNIKYKRSKNENIDVPDFMKDIFKNNNFNFD